jgi:5-(carboxyamino)imidazole ribonucleotide mutase
LQLTERGLPQGSKKQYFLSTVWAVLSETDRTALFTFKSKIARRQLVMKKVAVIMGSDSDLPVVSKAIDTLKNFGVPFEVHVFSAHRTPVEARDFSLSAREKGFGAIIAAAGKAAHLAGAIAANTTLPVIGIPVKSSTLDGLDALLSTVQMPGGIPVATVAIDGAQNAALLAVQILSVEDKALADKLLKSREENAKKVLEKNAAIEKEYQN